MIDSLSIIEIALSIRPRLTEILGNKVGLEMRQQLDTLLIQEVKIDADEAADKIWDLLTDSHKTQKWVTQFRQENDFQKIDRQAKGPNTLPVRLSRIAVPFFKCPKCDETWSRDRVGSPIPVCEVHQVPLEPVP